MCHMSRGQVSHVTYHTHTHTTEGHCDLENESAQWANSVTSKLGFPGGIRDQPDATCLLNKIQPTIFYISATFAPKLPF